MLKQKLLVAIVASVFAASAFAQAKPAAPATPAAAPTKSDAAK